MSHRHLRTNPENDYLAREQVAAGDRYLDGGHLRKAMKRYRNAVYASWWNHKARVRHLECVVEMEKRGMFYVIGSPYVSHEETFALLERYGRSDATILIRGESGSGKDLAARGCHLCSARAAKRFLRVNGASLSDALVASEMEGHKKGVFTGAHRDEIGVFREINGGTLWIDEVGDLKIQVQAMLLLLLEAGEVRALGDSHPFKVDVRVLCSTNQDLEDKVKQGLFREDLYYRINVLPLWTSPLRERPADIVLLGDFFLNFEEPGKKWGHIDRPMLLPAEVIRRLVQHPLHGNARKLRNIIAQYRLYDDAPRQQAKVIETHLGSFDPWGQERKTLPRAMILEALKSQLLLETLDSQLGDRHPKSRKVAKDRAMMLTMLRRLVAELQAAGMEPQIRWRDLKHLFGMSRPTAWRWARAVGLIAHFEGPKSYWTLPEEEA